MKKEHISGINFERMILAIGIIAFHFNSHSSMQQKLFLNFNTLNVGSVITTCFFILSGAMLYYNNESVSDIRGFYLKRFKTIFPAFWICYFIEFLRNVASTHYFNWAGAPKWTIVLSFLGIDGYFHNYLGGQDFYIIGEWFLGVIIILYILYPLLVKCLNKSVLITTAIILSLYIIYNISPEKPFPSNMIEYISCFYMGMIFMKYKKILFDSLPALFVAILCCVLLLIIQTDGSPVFYLVFSSGLFVILQRIGSVIEKWKPGKTISNFVGGISYEIFLVQHIVILNALKVFDPSETYKALALLIIVTGLSIIYAKLLNLTAAGLLTLFKKNK